MCVCARVFVCVCILYTVTLNMSEDVIVAAQHVNRTPTSALARLRLPCPDVCPTGFGSSTFPWLKRIRAVDNVKTPNLTPLTDRVCRKVDGKRTPPFFFGDNYHDKMKHLQ